MDCNTTNYGCNGGDKGLAFKYAETNMMELESSYPYTAMDGSCKYNAGLGVLNVTDYTYVTVENIDALKSAIDGRPVSVSIQANEPVFQLYTSGVITSTSCGQVHNHAVLAAGYGVENGTPYYWVKNSWGTGWGDNGYVKIGMADGIGICAVQSAPIWPTTD